MSGDVRAVMIMELYAFIEQFTFLPACVDRCRKCWVWEFCVVRMSGDIIAQVNEHDFLVNIGHWEPV